MNGIPCDNQISFIHQPKPAQHYINWQSKKLLFLAWKLSLFPDIPPRPEMPYFTLYRGLHNGLQDDIGRTFTIQLKLHSRQDVFTHRWVLALKMEEANPWNDGPCCTMTPRVTSPSQCTAGASHANASDWLRKCYLMKVLQLDRRTLPPCTQRESGLGVYWDGLVSQTSNTLEVKVHFHTKVYANQDNRAAIQY